MNPWWPFALFAFVASITPGPTNLLVLDHGARFGLRGAVPAVLGGCFGAALVVLSSGVGLGSLLVANPGVQAVLQCAGVLWLSYLAWQIYRSAAPSDEDSRPVGRFGFLAAAALQVVNPKAWMMAVAVVAVFATADAGHAQQVAWLSLMFFVISLPCLGCWALVGRLATHLLRDGRRMILFNRVLALLLLASAWSALFY